MFFPERETHAQKEVITIDTLFVINAAFPTGQIVASRGVYDLACQNPDFAQFVQKSLNRHVKGEGRHGR